MVDWDLVERRRARGWDWDRIAEDPKVDFHTDAAAGEPGRALRAMYYQRRSKSKRRAGGGVGPDEDVPPERRWTMLRVAAILAPLFGVWFVLALVFPSPIGFFFPAIPGLIVLLLLALAFLSFSLLRSADRWSPTVRNSLVIGAVVGLVLAGLLGLGAVVSGCPTLTSATSGEPNAFRHVGNPSWAENGAPVFFFYGSAACPFCSAASWSFQVALNAFGTLSGTYYDRSSLTDSYPGTPEVVFANAAYRSQWIDLQVVEGTDDNSLTAGATTSCTQSAYVSAYDANGAFPFLVLGGQYFHVGVLVDPGSLHGLTANQVQGQVDNQSGAAWDAISPTAYLLEAFLVKLNGGQPSSVASNPAVAAWLSQIH